VTKEAVGSRRPAVHSGTTDTNEHHRGLEREHDRVKQTAAGGALCGAVSALLAAGIAGCAPFDVNVSTDEPLKVDLSMEVHVYQHGEPDAAEKETRVSYKEAMSRRRNRMKEIQELKNSRLVGETRKGTLSIRNLPAGEYGNYVRETVKAENDDREFLIKREAEQKKVPEDEVRRMQWRHWQRKSFPGEWIEVEADEPGSYRWVQKKGMSEGGEEPADESKDSPDSEGSE